MFIHIDTKVQVETLPKIILDGKLIANPTLKEAATAGWRELPEIKEEAGSKIVAVEYVQSQTDPLKAEAIVTRKSDAEIDAEQQAAAQAETDARAKYEADRKAKRDEITKPFDGEQAEAIGKLFDLVRGFP